LKTQKHNNDVLKEHAESLFRILAEATEDVVAVFDADLNYLIANEAACKLLRVSREELEGNNLLELFPQLTASGSHRALLQAFSGEPVKSIRSEGTFTREGAKYISSYYPLKKGRTVLAVLAITKKLYFPDGKD
jgi:PAS domain S-box-containing protein